MKANLEELRTLVTFSESTRNPLILAMVNYMFKHISEPIQRGEYESNKFDAYFFQSKEDVEEGFDFLEEIGADFSEEIEIEL